MDIIKSLVQFFQESERQHKSAWIGAECFIEDLLLPFCIFTAILGWLLVVTGWGDNWVWLDGRFSSEWDWMDGFFGGGFAGLVILFGVYLFSAVFPYPVDWLADKIGYWRR